MRMAWIATAMVCALTASTGLSQEKGKLRKFPGYGLSIELPEALKLKEIRSAPGTHLWEGVIEKSKLQLRLEFLPRDHYRLKEPSDVLGVLSWDQKQTGSPFRMQGRTTRSGSYGFVPYASLSRSEARPASARDEPVKQGWFLGGILKKHGYAFSISVVPPIPKAKANPILDFLENGIHYEGQLRDTTWTKERCRERWEKHAPPSTHKQLRITRTRHYLIMTNSGGGKLFAKKMEEFYKKIRKVYPFDEVKERPLMPVFLFRSSKEYFEFYEKVHGYSGQGSKGHAYDDYYATWYESPNDPVHIHEATHQIFFNRLNLPGGGSWFQEGVAEYMSTKKSERNSARNRMARGDFFPLRKFMAMRSLLHDSGYRDMKGRYLAHEAYLQAATLVEFLMQWKGKKRWPRFLETVGSFQEADLATIEGAFKEIYESDIAGVEKAFLRWCKR